MSQHTNEARPGYARFGADDSLATIDRKMRTAFSPLRAMREGWNRVFVPGYRPRDPETGRFVKRHVR